MEKASHHIFEEGAAHRQLSQILWPFNLKEN